MLRCFSSLAVSVILISPVLRLVGKSIYVIFCPYIELMFESMFGQVAIYTTDIQLEWREVNGGQLPSPRTYLRAAVVGNTIYLTGGGQNLNEILSWDPITESWNLVGNLAVGRSNHAAVAVSRSIISLSCNN